LNNIKNIKLGIIYYSDELKLHNKLDYIEYINVNSIDNIKFQNKPTLIIGWNLVKNQINTNNVLNREINELYSWTFSFNEKKTEYINDLNDFLYIKILKIFDIYNYKILSPVFYENLRTKNDYINYLNNIDITNIFLDKNLNINILSLNNIYRIDLNELKYFNIDPKYILFFLKRKFNNIIYDKNNEMITQYTNFFKTIDTPIVSKYMVLFTK